MDAKNRSEQEWVYHYLQKRDKPLPLVLGTKGTWGINGKQAIILVAFTMPDILVFRDMHNVVKNPIRTMKFKEIVYRFGREDPFLKECEGRSPMSREGMNRPSEGEFLL